MTKVSFVMPVRNCEAWVSDSIRDILNQSLEDIELLMFDDSSTDGTAEVLKYWANRDKKIKLLISEVNRGAAWCRNKLNSKVESDIICVADAGDRYHHDRAGISYDYLFNEYPDIDIFSTAVEVIDDLEQLKYYEFPEKLTLGKKPVVCHPTVAYRKDVADRIKYREWTKHSDLYEAFLLDAAKVGFKHGFVKDVYVKKRENPGGRDISEARKFKKKVYEEFGLPIPQFLKNA